MGNADKIDKGIERRSYFRIDDSISLSMKIIKQDDMDEALKKFSENRNAFSLLNTFAHQKEHYLPQRRQIEKNHPEIAAYLNYIDVKIDALANLLSSYDNKMPEHPTHQVNLSAQGMRFLTRQNLKEDDIVELKIQIYPSRARIFVIGTVIWCNNDLEGEEVVNSIAIDFTHIHDSDRELLVKHIHECQIQQISRQSQDDKAE